VLERLERRELLTGGLDPTFGTGGYVETTIPVPGNAYADRTAIDPRNGDVVVLGHMYDPSGTELIMARYLPSGQLDTSFASAGELIVRNVDRTDDLVVQGDGKIVVSGEITDPAAHTTATCVGRFNADGSLDTSFGTNGWTSDLGFFYFDGHGATVLALQGDGKILVAGAYWLDRLTTGGQLDPTFNGTGKASLGYFAFNYGPSALATAPDGKIVVAGLLGVARFTPSGQLDTDPVSGFGYGGGGPRPGIVQGDSFRWGSMLVQPDGKIVLGNSWNYGGSLIARMNTDGSFDTSFGSGGFVVNANSVQTIALEGDGKLLVGEFHGFGPGPFSITRYDQFGSLDTSFGGTGHVSATVGPGAALADLAVTPSGDVIAVGTAFQPFALDFALAAITPQGALDLSFGSGGQVTTQFLGIGGLSDGFAMVQTDGKILIAGDSAVNGYLFVCLARYLPNGALDSTFGNGGVAESPYSQMQPRVAGMVLQGDGKILVPTYSYEISGSGVMRFNADGSVDTSFGNQGAAMAGSFYPARSGLLLQADGSMVLVGSNYQYGATSIIAARLHADGSFDSSFGSGGLAAIPNVGNAAAAALDAAGDIDVVASQFFNGYPVSVAIARLTPAGQLDPGFGSGGIVLRYYGAVPNPSSMVVLPNGKILVGGATGVTCGSTFVMEQLKKDGSLDTKFGNGGVVTTSFGNGTLFPLAVRPDGTIVTAGITSDTNGNWMSVAQFLPNGRSDPGFGQGGRTVTPIPINYDGIGVAIQGDGKIVAVGSSLTTIAGDVVTAAAVARFLDGGNTPSGNAPAALRAGGGHGQRAGNRGTSQTGTSSTIIAIPPAPPAASPAPKRPRQAVAYPAVNGPSLAMASQPSRTAVIAASDVAQRFLGD
jgi:uncharacterized delta-60 repeat protein